MEEEIRIPVTFMGQDLGTADDWDQVADECLYFYHYQPSNLALTLFGLSEYPQLKSDEYLDFQLNYLDGIAEMVVCSPSKEDPDDVDQKILFSVKWGLIHLGH